MSSAATARQSAYDIGKPLGQCAVTQQPIEPGTKFFAALRETPTGFERLDISPAAWEPFDRTHLLAFWQAVMPEPNKTRKLLVDDTVLCDLFERLADVDEPAKVSFRFVLGLILLRKRLLAYDSTVQEGGRDVWVVKLRGRPEPLRMIDPHLTEDQVGDVSAQLGQILNSDEL